jgi:rod shape-determining protein MreC
MRDHFNTRPIKLRSDQTPAAASRRPFLLAFMLGILAAALIILDIWGGLAPLRGTFQHAVSPVAQKLASMHHGVGEIWSEARSIQQLRTENESLREEISQLRAELLKREHIVIENNRLRQRLDIEEDRPWRLLGAEVLIHSPDAGRRVMTISRGSTDKVEVGMAVVGQIGKEPASLIGIVEDVMPHTASVLLITDIGSQISARVVSKNTLSLGLVQGQWQKGSRLLLEQLDRATPLRPGQEVVSAGMTGKLGLPMPLTSVPPDIPIGMVEKVVKKDDLSQFAELRPFVDPDQVRYVWIILNHND